MLIRTVKSQDVKQLLPLMQQLGYCQDFNELNKRVKSFISQEGYGIAVVEKNNKIIGMICWSKSLMLVANKIRLRIEGLIVDKNHQNQGIGKKLILYLEDYAKKFPLHVIEVTSGLRRDAGIHEFYKKCGYKNEGSMAKVYLRK